MKEVNPESKMAAIKALAIIGFITAIVFAVWAGVQIVRFAPSAWTSLASIAETVYGKAVILSVTPSKDVVNSGESFEIEWTDVRKEGAYTLTFSCMDGVSALVRDQSGADIPVSCEMPIPLPQDHFTANVTIASEKKRFVDMPFTLRFMSAKGADQSQEKTETVTVVNVTVAQATTSEESPIDIFSGIGTSKTDDTPIETPDTKPAPKPETPKADTPVKPSTPTTPRKPVAGTPIVTTTAPISDPNGHTDLSVSFLGIGSWDKNTKTYTPKATLDNDVDGAVRFEIKNAGTKTSGSWYYKVTLPGDTQVSYRSDDQKPLQPTERQTVTIAFSDVPEDVGTEHLKIEIVNSNDSNNKNNELNWAVKVTN